MWKKKLKRKRMQFLIIGFILLFASAILTCFVNIASDVTRLTNKTYASNHADYYVISNHGTSKILKDKVENLKTIKCYKATDNLNVYHKNKTMLDFQNETYYVVLDNYKDLDWIITPKEGNLKENGPKQGEVWVEKIIADSHNVKISDNYVIQNKNKDKLKVTTIVNDSIKPNTIANAQFIYINRNDFNKLKGNEEADFNIIKSNKSKDEIQKIIEKKFSDKDTLYNIRSIDDLKTSAKMVNKLSAGLGIIADIFMIIVNIVIMRFLVRSTILSEYQAIGTYKSLGFTTKDIKGFYSKCYLLVGLISSTIGTILGIPLSKVIGSVTMRYITDYNISYTSIIAALLVLAGILLLLWINIKLALRKIKKITPVDALRIGVTSSKKKIKKSLIKNASSSFAMAINDIFKSKGRSLLVILVVALSFYVSLAFINICYSFEKLDDKASAWVGSPTSHCCIESNNGELPKEIFDYLDKSKYVDHYVYGSLYEKASVESLNKSISLKQAWVMSFNTYEDGLYDINYAEGRPPKNKGEIGIDSASLSKSNVKVGDYIKLKVNGKEDTFLITGTYDTVGGSAGIHMFNDYFKDNNMDIVYSAAVLLKDKNDFGKIKKYIESNYDNCSVKRISEYIGDVKNSIQDIMIPVSVMIISIFIIFTLLIIINLITTCNKEDEKNFGILKAYGFTTGYIIRRSLFKIMILSSIGLAISVIINELVTSKLFWKGLGCDGYIISVPYSAAFIISGFIVILLIAVLLTLGIKKISPKELMED